ncbi:MAG: SCP2 sterol-binding domain-containing protein, partial [Labilithrix sp.]|nr:SCP2 sterol-binding domain-containing protein [Labilithrix sp.]
PASAKASAAPAILEALAARLAKTPNLAKEVGAKVALVVGDKAWLLDLTGAGAIAEGKGAADVTLTLGDDDLVALAKGEGLRELYQHGRVRIDGDPRVAHKLNFWKGLV